MTKPKYFSYKCVRCNKVQNTNWSVREAQAILRHRFPSYPSAKRAKSLFCDACVADMEAHFAPKIAPKTG